MTRRPDGPPRVLVIDGTGRGHALCRLFTRTDPDVTVYYGPGCDVVREDRIVVADSIRVTEPETVLSFLAAHPVDFVFVSHIDGLSTGLVDALRAAGHRTVGPTREAAALEASKERGKRFCTDHGIPTAPYRAFTDPAAARTYIETLPYACVVKTDGLTPDGDGSVVCSTAEEALSAVDRFAGEPGADFHVVVEKRLRGEEVSVFALLDGENALLLPTARDFKRTLEGDLGKNCDGMGSIAPHPQAGPALDADIRRTLLDPLVAGLTAEGLHFSGFLYIGAMITADGLQVIELNARFGDSEAQVVLPGLRGDFTELCRAVLERRLAGEEITSDGLVRCSVALTQGSLDPSDPEALPGWPFGAFAAGQTVTGLEDVDPAEADVYLANVRLGADGLPVTSGGRVLHVVGAGSSLPQARARAYRGVGRIAFAGRRCRDDIGLTASREKALA